MLIIGIKGVNKRSLYIYAAIYNKIVQKRLTVKTKQNKKNILI